MNVFSRIARSWTLVYEPMRYWNTRENPNAPVGETEDRVRFDIDYIRQHVSSGDRVLELGPGIGRTFPAYEPNTELTTLDISQIYQERLAAAASSSGLRLEQRFLSGTDEAFPFSDEQFDVGVSFQVFIHQPPDVFAHNLSEMTRVCRRLIVSVGHHLNGSRGKKASASHVFSHDYILEASRRGKLLSHVLTRDGVLYFVLHDDGGHLLDHEK